MRRRSQPIAGLVLAAGESRRFGSPKQLAPYRGRPLLEQALAAMAAARSVDVVAVVLGAHADEVLAAVDLHGARPVLAPDWAAGQAASLRAGVAALRGEVDAIVITLGDQPEIATAAIDRVVAARDGAGASIRASYGGRAGHPALIERSLFEAAASLRGDEGARSLLGSARLVPCDDLGSDVDIDLPEQISAA